MVRCEHCGKTLLSSRFDDPDQRGAFRCADCTRLLDLFKRWTSLGQSPRRLLENYAARNNLTQKDVDCITDIMRYAAYLKMVRQ